MLNGDIGVAPVKIICLLHEFLKSGDGGNKLLLEKKSNAVFFWFWLLIISEVLLSLSYSFKIIPLNDEPPEI